MKKMIIMLLIAATNFASLSAQNDLIGGGKVKKEKKLKMGLSLGIGTMGYSATQYSIKNGILGSVNYVATMPLNNNPESRWLGEMGIGITYCKNSAEWEKSSRSNHDSKLFEIPNVTIRLRYTLNPLSTRGKWYVYPGLSVCPIAIFPVNETSDVNRKYKNLSDEFGCTLGIEGGIGYSSNHLGFSVGPFGKMGATYSNDKGNSPIMYGGILTLHYMF
ncbi:MAG: hypothetical protein IKX24_11590 [Prevotella sp.]|nr:hypothetical protein [Prevotella sp.]